MDELDDIFGGDSSKLKKKYSYEDDLDDEEDDDLAPSVKSSAKSNRGRNAATSLEEEWENFGLKSSSAASVKSYSTTASRRTANSKYTLKSQKSYVTKQELQEELLEHKDEYQDLANLFELWLNEGIVTTDDRLRCPLLLSAGWRKKMKEDGRRKSYDGADEDEEDDDQHEDEEDEAAGKKIPYCKGNANGFPDLNSLYLHASTKGSQCPFHYVLASFLVEQYPDKISHGIPVGTGIRFRPVGPDQKDKNLKDLFQEGLSKRPKDINMKIVWPPTVCISKLPVNLNSKNKIMDAFARFNPIKAAPYYDVHGFSGDCILSFSADPEGFFYAQRLVAYLNDKARKDFDRQTSGFFATPKQMQMAERVLATKKIVTGWKVSTYAHDVYHPARKILQDLILTMGREQQGSFEETGTLPSNASALSTIRSNEISGGWENY